MSRRFEKGDRVMEVFRLSDESRRVISVKVGRVRKTGRDGCLVRFEEPHEADSGWRRNNQLEAYDPAAIAERDGVPVEEVEEVERVTPKAIAPLGSVTRPEGKPPGRVAAHEPASPPASPDPCDAPTQEGEGGETSAEGEDWPACADLDSIEGDVEALLSMRRPMAERIQGLLRAASVERRETRELFERERDALMEAWQSAEADLSARVERLSVMLDRLNADAVAVADIELARPRDRERVDRYKAHIRKALEDGQMLCWNDIRLAVLEEHPEVDTAFLQSALGAMRAQGEVDWDGRRGGDYWLDET